MPLLYDLGIGLYSAAIRAAAPFKPKARQWLRGRDRLWERLEARSEALHGCLWMHCASVGEFEQGRPVLEALAAQHPRRPILITFFSPSGFQARHNYRPEQLPGSTAVHVEYLPMDSVANARRMLRTVRPAEVWWVRYEFWYHHLLALQKVGVPVYLLSGIFRGEQPFFRWYGGAWRRMLGAFRHLFVQNVDSRALLASIGVTRVTVSGDTRYDRVAAIADAAEELPIAKAFRGEAPVLVCGSTWPRDEEQLLEAFARLGRAPKCIVVPHELDPGQLAGIEARFPKPLVRWSELEGCDPANIAAMLGTEPQGTLLVDRMGLLARLYRYGDVAYVGGGFDTGIHNILEPAAWGVPVIHGPDHRKFMEAKAMLAEGAGFCVQDGVQLAATLQKLLDKDTLQHASAAAQRHVRSQRGATARVLEVLRALEKAQ